MNEATCGVAFASAPTGESGPGYRYAHPEPRDYAAILCSNAINASGAVTFGEWLASIS
jgi:hypothetical protein